MDLRRLYRTVRAKSGWLITVLGVFKWVADWWGRGAAVKDWAERLPKAARFLTEPWITPIVIIVGLALVVWAALDRGGSVGFDNARWLPERYRTKKIPHEYIVLAIMVVILTAILFIMRPKTVTVTRYVVQASEHAGASDKAAVATKLSTADAAKIQQNVGGQVETDLPHKEIGKKEVGETAGATDSATIRKIPATAKLPESDRAGKAPTAAEIAEEVAKRLPRPKDVEKDREQPIHIEPRVDVKVEHKPSPARVQFAVSTGGDDNTETVWTYRNKESAKADDKFRCAEPFRCYLPDKEGMVKGVALNVGSKEWARMFVLVANESNAMIPHPFASAAAESTGIYLRRADRPGEPWHSSVEFQSHETVDLVPYAVSAANLTFAIDVKVDDSVNAARINFTMYAENLELRIVRIRLHVLRSAP